MLFSPTSLGNALMTVIAFIILLYIIYHFAFKSIINILDERKAMIDSELQKGATAKSEGEATVIEANELMQAARQNSAQMIQDAKAQALEQKQFLISEANSEIEVMRDHAQKALDKERLQLHQQSEKEVVTLAIELTKKLVQREVTEEEHQDFIEQFIERLEANAK